MALSGTSRNLTQSARVVRIEIMVQSWSTNPCQPLLNTLLGATRIAYFQSVTE